MLRGRRYAEGFLVVLAELLPVPWPPATSSNMIPRYSRESSRSTRSASTSALPPSPPSGIRGEIVVQGEASRRAHSSESRVDMCGKRCVISALTHSHCTCGWSGQWSTSDCSTTRSAVRKCRFSVHSRCSRNMVWTFCARPGVPKMEGTWLMARPMIWYPLSRMFFNQSRAHSARLVAALVPSGGVDGRSRSIVRTPMSTKASLGDI
eukprot:413096-Pyramimonas_sp.AAC.1